MFEKITSWLHNDSKKSWNKLKKGDKLVMLIPEDLAGLTYKYTCQIVSVIAIKEYNSICNVRFKYTENDKRKRVNLAVNKLKYNLPYLAIKRNTEWAREYNPVYGDIIVTLYNDSNDVNNIYHELIRSKIDEQEKFIENEKNKLNKLRSIQYDNVSI